MKTYVDSGETAIKTQVKVKLKDSVSIEKSPKLEIRPLNIIEGSTPSSETLQGGGTTSSPDLKQRSQIFLTPQRFFACELTYNSYGTHRDLCFKS